MTSASISDIRSYLDGRLSPKRLRHTEGVRETALLYSKAHGLDLNVTERAALLHDVAKSMSTAELLDACRRYDIPLMRDDLQLPGVLHACVGALMAERDFGLDAVGCCAIRAHTTGWEPMGPLDMVLYVADYTEPGRAVPEAAELRELASVDLAAATVRAMTLRLIHLLDRGVRIHPRTVEARNALLAQLHAETD